MGAKCEEGSKLTLSDEIWSEMKAVQLKWLHVPTSGDSKRHEKLETVGLPVYLHSSRQNLLFTLDLKIGAGLNASQFYERGVAIVCSGQNL